MQLRCVIPFTEHALNYKPAQHGIQRRNVIYACMHAVHDVGEGAEHSLMILMAAAHNLAAAECRATRLLLSCAPEYNPMKMPRRMRPQQAALRVMIRHGDWERDLGESLTDYCEGIGYFKFEAVQWQGYQDSIL